MGCAPLWLASGSGAASRRILGTVVVVGMLAATLFGVFIIPATYYLVERFAGRGRKKGYDEVPAMAETEAGD